MLLIGILCGVSQFAEATDTQPWEKEWIGLHVGNYMILIDTWVPRSYNYDNHILGHPYYSLYKYDSVYNYPTNDEKGDALSQRMVNEAKSVDSAVSKNARHWENNYQKYRIGTIVFYCIILVGAGIVVRLLFGRRVYHQDCSA